MPYTEAEFERVFEIAIKSTGDFRDFPGIDYGELTINQIVRLEQICSDPYHPWMMEFQKRVKDLNGKIVQSGVAQRKPTKSEPLSKKQSAAMIALISLSAVVLFLVMIVILNSMS